VDTRGVARQVAAAAAVDREALERDVVGAHAHDAAAARAHEQRPPAADEADRLVDEQVALVLARLDLDRRSGRSFVEPDLERTKLGSGRPSFERAGGERRHLLGVSRRGERQERDEGGEPHRLS
jgi:hypothetical protein